MRPISVFLKHPSEIVRRLLKKYSDYLPDSLFLKFEFKERMGYPLNLKHPVTFSEKLQWLKLYDRRPIYTTMVDKYAVKKYVADIIGEEYIIPTLGVWDKPEDIDWDRLPNQFVLKCTHDSGGLVICRDKENLDKEAAIKKISGSLARDYYKPGREWPYKNVPKRIIAEQFMEAKPDVKDLPDYKWYCFNGEPKFCQVIQNRSMEEKIDFFDTEWHHQDFIGLNPKATHAEDTPGRPLTLDTQIRIARELSKGNIFSRVDLYEIGEKAYFGEITLYPGSGFGQFKPEQYNEILGEMLKLPGKKMGGGNCQNNLIK